MRYPIESYVAVAILAWFFIRLIGFLIYMI